MPALSVEGVILRKFYLRETSYILVVFTKEFGKVKGVIKGVRKPYPQFAGNFEIFARCQLLFYRKKRSAIDLITQCEALEFFLPVRKDIERLTYANYFIELIETAATPYDANEALYRTLVESLRMLAGPSSAKRVGRIFEIKFLGALGLSPSLDKCAACGAPVEEGSPFSVKSGGLLCRGCERRDRSGFRISPGTVNFMRKIQKSELARTSLIKVTREVGKETEEVLKRFLRYHINRPMKSLAFLEQLRRVGIV